MPLMEVANRLAQAAGARDSKRVVTSLRDVRIARWIVLERLQRFTVLTEADGEEIIARLTADDNEASRSRGDESLADAVAEIASRYPNSPAALPPLANTYPVDLPYSSGAVFHGPAFQLLRSLRYGDRGSTAMLDAAAGSVPVGLLHTALLDGVFHAIPNDNLSLWFPEFGDDLVALPHRISWLRLYGKTPVSGVVRCEVRADGFDGGPRFPAFRAQLLVENQVWADLRVVEILLPKGQSVRPHRSCGAAFCATGVIPKALACLAPRVALLNSRSKMCCRPTGCPARCLHSIKPMVTGLRSLARLPSKTT